ncbi:MAG: hypothetical protein AAB834_07285 [Patescibacteria group bacterium]
MVAENLHINPALEQYLDGSYNYDFAQGPDVVRNRDDALRNGINCVSLAHLALRDLFGCELPPKLMCAEMYCDRDYFAPVESFLAMREGDLVWFGIANPTIPTDEFEFRYEGGNLANWADFPVKHVAIYTGVTDSEGNHVLLHSTFREGNTLWPLARFNRYRRYEKLYGITRLIVDQPAIR